MIIGGRKISHLAAHCKPKHSVPTPHNLFSECGDGMFSLCPRRSMNGFLIVYLCILISKAVINTVLKYAWQWSPDRDEPWYNHRTENERQRHVVGFPTSSKATPTSLDLKYCKDVVVLPPPPPGDPSIHGLPGLHGFI